MSKYALHIGQLSVDTSTTMNYDIKELMTKIIESHGTISWEVMGKETRGIIFVSLDEEDNTKLTCHGSMVAPDYEGEELGPENYLWVMIDKVEASFRARFLTPESASSIVKADFANVHQPQGPSSQMMEMAERLIAHTARNNFFRGLAYGALFSMLMMATIVGIILLCM